LPSDTFRRIGHRTAGGTRYVSPQPARTGDVGWVLRPAEKVSPVRRLHTRPVSAVLTDGGMAGFATPSSTVRKASACTIS